MSAVYFSFLLALLLSSFSCDYAESREIIHDETLPSPPGICLNCTICQYPCHNLPPPPASSLPSPPFSGGYPLYGTPPPPPATPEPESGYPSYGTPPPPPATPEPESGYPSYGPPPTPPGQVNCSQFPAQCCHPPPNNPYVPVYNYADASFTRTFLFSIMLLILSFAALF